MAKTSTEPTVITIALNADGTGEIVTKRGQLGSLRRFTYTDLREIVAAMQTSVGHLLEVETNPPQIAAVPPPPVPEPTTPSTDEPESSEAPALLPPTPEPVEPEAPVERPTARLIYPEGIESSNQQLLFDVLQNEKQVLQISQELSQHPSDWRGNAAAEREVRRIIGKCVVAPELTRTTFAVLKQHGV
jgi:hypothetical protein